MVPERVKVALKSYLAGIGAGMAGARAPIVKEEAAVSAPTGNRAAREAKPLLRAGRLVRPSL